MSRLAITIVALATLGCSGGREGTELIRPEPAPSPSRAQPASPAPDPVAPPTTDERPPISEAVARALLARRFRAAGFRIRNDVRLRTGSPAKSAANPGATPGATPGTGSETTTDVTIDVTVDGYDPAAQVGFEYIDTAELGSDLAASERAALARAEGYKILVIDPAPQARVLELADIFLGQITPP